MIDNIAPGKYHLFAIKDGNNNFLYDEGAEEIAFEDSIVVPYAEFHEEIDTIFSETDTIVVYGHTDFFPEPFFLRQFTEDIFDQYLEVSKRDSRYKCTFVFNESVKDSFELSLVGNNAKDWYQIEYNENIDSLIVWIADTTIARFDTLFMEVGYLQLDTLEQLYFHRDTVEMNFEDKKAANTAKKKKPKDDEEEEKPKPVEQFSWKTDLSGTTVELNKTIGLYAPEPIFSFDSTMILLYLAEDTLKKPLEFNFFKDTLEYRKYNVAFDWEPETGYGLEIDSAAAVNIYGITSKRLKASFSGREEDYYGVVTLDISGVNMPVLVQLVGNSERENIIKQKSITDNGKVTFDYLKPDKYRIKFVYDKNGNGKWDTGSNQDKYQPEWVTYLNEVVKVKGNWEIEIPSVDLTPNPGFVKNIRDLEEEERLRKEAEKKARMEEQEQQQPQGDQMQNFIR